MTTYDQARQFGKVYVGALNTSDEAFAALFTPGATVTVLGEAAAPSRVREVTPAGLSAYRGARMNADGSFAVLVRVRDATSVDDREHVLQLDGAGRIVALAA